MLYAVLSYDILELDSVGNARGTVLGIDFGTNFWPPEFFCLIAGAAASHSSASNQQLQK